MNGHALLMGYDALFIVYSLCLQARFFDLGQNILGSGFNGFLSHLEMHNKTLSPFECKRLSNNVRNEVPVGQCRSEILPGQPCSDDPADVCSR